MRNGLLIVYLSTSFFAFSQVYTRSFDGECERIGLIDTTRLSPIQAQAIAELLLHPLTLQSPFLATRPADTLFLQPQFVTNEFLALQLKLNQLALDNLPYWDSVKKIRLNELYVTYQLHITAIVGLTNPEVLTELVACDSCMLVTYPLTSSKSVLLQSWEMFNLSELKTALDPVAFEQAFERQKNSTIPELWARIEWMRYRWWPCIEQNNRSILSTSELEKQFEALFLQMNKKCM
jgi:hypothetical protein